MRRIAAALGLALAWASAASAQPAPAGDFHQHLFSPAAAALVSPPPPAAPVEPITAKRLIALLDEAGIRRATVLSVAYTFSNPARNVADDAAKARAENDWTSREVAQYPDRLIGFCSVNPLRDYALAEIDRCAKDPHLRRGLKLHIGNSAVDYDKAADVARLRAVFAAADAHRMAIVVHMRSSFSQKLPYGAKEARVFLDQVLPAAPHVPVQIAHLAGGGGWDDPAADAALGVLIEAVRDHDLRARRLWFDVTSVAMPDAAPAQGAAIAARLRQIGLRRVLYGSDAATAGNVTPREGWATFLAKVPLSAAEAGVIARNVPPYAR